MPPPAGSPFKTALVGCGRIGERHGRILASSPESRLDGFVDSELTKAQSYAGRHGGRPYAEIPEMIAAESPDVLAVCTPSGVHAEGVIAASRAGVRNIVVEK